MGKVEMRVEKDCRTGERSGRTPAAGRWLMVAALLLAAGCAPQPLEIDRQSRVPDQWQAAEAGAGQQDELLREAPGWLAGFADARLDALVLEGMAQNPALAAARARLEQAGQALVMAGADRFPQVGLNLGWQRPESNTESVSLNAGISWDPDLWGELSARQRQAQLEYAAAGAEWQQKREALAAQISQGWFAVQEAELLLQLHRQRSENLASDLEIIESGYRQGLYEALDLYLARNDLSAQQATVAQQQLTRAAASRALEELLGRYPAAELSSAQPLALIEAEPALVLPAQMVLRRPDLQASWLKLLAADQALAAAHRARFPAFSLSADYGGSSAALRSLVSSGNLAWLLGASLSQSLFDAGRLKAAQQQQAARRDELENDYLSALYAAFSEVENALDSRRALHEQYRLYLAAQDNALQAEQLAFEGYRRGLEDFTTVLEAQRRALDAQTRVIALRRALLDNRVELALALGGRFDGPASGSALEVQPE